MMFSTLGTYEPRTPSTGRNEQRAGQDHEQADRQVAPQHREVAAPQPALLRRHRPDPPGRRLALERPLEPFRSGGHGPRSSLRPHYRGQVPGVAATTDGLSARSDRAPPTGASVP